MAPAWSPLSTTAMNSSTRAREGIKTSSDAGLGKFIDRLQPAPPFRKRRECQHCESQQYRWEHHEIDRRPAVIRQQLPGRKRAQRHGAEHQEIVEGLHLVALLRPMRLQHQRGGADEAEIPAYSEHDQRGPEMQRSDAGKSDAGRERL